MSRESEKKKVNGQQVVIIVFLVLTGAVCGMIYTAFFVRTEDTRSLPEEILGIGVWMLAVYAAYLLHITLHEAGHLVFGLLTGYRFCSFRIFSIMLVKGTDGLTWKRFGLPGTAGQCLMAPPEKKDGRYPVMLYNLGGPLMNALVGILSLGAFSLCWPDARVPASLLLLLAVIGFMTAAINGIPMRMGMVDNDGRNAFSLARNPEAAEAFWIQMKIGEQTAAGVRLKDMPSEWFAVPSDEAMQHGLTAAVGVFACNRLMDAERFDEADAMMARVLEMESGLLGLHRCLLICDRLYLELIRENRPEVLAGMYTAEQKQFMKAMKTGISVIRTEYALALLRDRDAAKAARIRSMFEKQAKRYPYRQEADSERALMELADLRAGVESIGTANAKIE